MLLWDVSLSARHRISPASVPAGAVHWLSTLGAPKTCVCLLEVLIILRLGIAWLEMNSIVNFQITTAGGCVVSKVHWACHLAAFISTANVLASSEPVLVS